MIVVVLVTCAALTSLVVVDGQNLTTIAVGEKSTSVAPSITSQQQRHLPTSTDGTTGANHSATLTATTTAATDEVQALRSRLEGLVEKRQRLLATLAGVGEKQVAVCNNTWCMNRGVCYVVTSPGNVTTSVVGSITLPTAAPSAAPHSAAATPRCVCDQRWTGPRCEVNRSVLESQARALITVKEWLRRGPLTPRALQPVVTTITDTGGPFGDIGLITAICVSVTVLLHVLIAVCVCVINRTRSAKTKGEHHSMFSSERGRQMSATRRNGRRPAPPRASRPT